MVSLYWLVFRHPMSLQIRPLHPPTALVRWLAGFSLELQVDHGLQLMGLLPMEEERVMPLRY